MHGMLFGMETELAFAAIQDDRAPPRDARRILGELYALASDRLVSLPEEGGVGIFLANGARFYLDRGEHPELCTPECRTPEELVRWQLACERILAELVAELEKRYEGLLRAALYRCNVDYSGNGETWGCHESYLHRRTHAELAPQLIPHLVTRLVYTGAGGFDNRAGRLDFLLSPRVPHLVREVGADTPERGIYNTRDEPLADGGYQRLHVICGESLCSELSNYLKLGTTALVVRLVDAGVCRGRGLALAEPLRAMRRFARDPGVRARVRLADGRRLSAIEIQSEYLAMVEQHLGADFLPDWAGALCASWRRVLEALERDPGSLATSLDWAIKHALFRDRIERAGGDPAAIPRASGLGAELCEIDTRFGELSERALFHALDEAGALAHRIPGRGALEDAIREAPPGGRAEQRGRAIRELHARRRRYACRWDAIVDREKPRVLDLSDPFATAARWRDPRAPVPRRELSPPHQRRIDEGLRLYNAAELRRSAATLERAIRDAERAGDPEREADARFWCSAAHHDVGRLADAERVLAPALRERDGVSLATRLRAWTRHALILVERPAPLAEIERALGWARELVRRAPGEMGLSRVGLLEARVLGARGRTPEAVVAAECALAESSGDPINFSADSHLRWLLTFLLRARRYRRALAQLDAWRERLGPGDGRSYPGTSLAIAESGLALGVGPRSDALSRALCALERSEGLRRHRCRAAAIVALLDAAAAARAFESADRVLAEAQTWREVEIGELRFDLLLAQARLELARDRGRAGELVAAARRDAELLDERLDCTRHQLALDRALERAR